MSQTPAEFEAERHKAEVDNLVRVFRTGGKKAAIALLNEIEAGKRGKPARDRLEADAMAIVLKDRA